MGTWFCVFDSSIALAVTGKSPYLCPAGPFQKLPSPWLRGIPVTGLSEATRDPGVSVTQMGRFSSAQRRGVRDSALGQP